MLGMRSSTSPKDAVFSMMDQNGDGVISRQEWTQAMRGQIPMRLRSPSPMARKATLTPKRSDAIKVGIVKPSSRPGSVEPALLSNHAEWEKDQAALEQAEMELHQNQMRLLREQMSNFARELMQLRQVVGEMQQDRGAVDSHHASMAERMDFLEKAFGDSADNHMKELQAMQDAHSKQAQSLQALHGLHAHSATMEERINYVEKLIGDSADQRIEENKGRHVFGIPAAGAILERLRGIERLEGIVNDVQAKHDNHGRALESLKTAHDRHAISMSKYTRDIEQLADRHNGHAGDHATLAERVGLMEQHTQNGMAMHHATMNERVASLEQAVGVPFLNQGYLRTRSFGERVDGIERALGSCLSGNVSLLDAQPTSPSMLDPRPYGRSGSPVRSGASARTLGSAVVAAALAGGTVGDRLQALEKRVVEDTKKVDSCCSRMNLLREAWCLDTPR